MKSLYNKRLEKNIKRIERYHFLMNALKEKLTANEISTKSYLELQESINNQCGYCTSSRKLV